MQAWFVLLFSTICLEGLGRKYLPQVPSVAFYFLKDFVLLFGYYRYRPAADVRRVIKHLYRGFDVVLIAAIVWTVIEMLNPHQKSFPLAVIGIRAYWLWWSAPALIASVLQNETNKKRAIQVFLGMAAIVSVFAIIQFASPPTANVNLYSVVDGEEVYADQAIVYSTGRARVASTFSFLTGFQDFTILIPALLLSIGLDAKNPQLRRMAFAATLLSSSVVPMSGSRTSVLLGGGVLILAVWSAGLVFTRVGRRVLMGAILASIVAITAFPDAFLGVQSRFEDQDETNSRYESMLMVLPPVALAQLDYPAIGEGTGMQQNARGSLHVESDWNYEVEPARYLAELGPVGFMLVWASKLGLIVALVRAYKLLKKAGRRGAAAAALSYAFLTMNGNLTFDHIFQSLYFIGCGFILAEVVAVVRAQAKVQVLAPPAERAPMQVALANVSVESSAGSR